MIFKILFLLIRVSFQMNLWLLHIGMSSCDFFKNNLIYFFLAVLGLHCYTGFSLLVASGCYFLVAVASLVVEHGTLVHRLNSCGAGLSRSVTCGVFSDQGPCPCLLRWQADALPLSHHRILLCWFCSSSSWPLVFLMSSCAFWSLVTKLCLWGFCWGHHHHILF